MAKQDKWQNRIVGSADVSPESLLANPANWREHPAKQQNALRDVLNGERGVGWVARVMVNKRTSELWPDDDRNVETVVDGHLRCALAMRHNQPTVPVDYVDLTPEEEALVLATFDPIGAMAQASAERLGALLEDVQTESVAIGEMLDGLKNSAGYAIEPEAYSDLDDEIKELDGEQEVQIVIVVQAKYKDEVEQWLANGERVTGPGMGIGVLKRCGLL